MSTMDGFRDFSQKQPLQGRKLAEHPTGPRAIDREGGFRVRPIKVIVAGMSRTGTFSMYAALTRLGMKPYHMAEAAKMPLRDFAIVHEALEAKKNGSPFGKDEFDKWVGDFDLLRHLCPIFLQKINRLTPCIQALCDMPMCLLVEELCAAYPDAKVILTTRDPIAWRKSIDKTLLAMQGWRSTWFLSFFSEECRIWSKMVQSQNEAMDDWSIEAYDRHNAGVRAVVPKDNLLEFRIGEDGWKEMCEFLDVPVVEGSFPKTNDSSMFIPAFSGLVRGWAWKALWQVGGMTLVPLVGIVAAVWYRRKYL